MTREPTLRLAPSSARGWFGGKCLSAVDAVSVEYGVSLADAAVALDACFEGRDTPMTAVLARYEGTCDVVRFRHVVEEPRRGADGGAGCGHRHAEGPAQLSRRPLLQDAEWDLTGRRYRQAVMEVRDRIAAGDVYVLNLTARLRGSVFMPPEDVFEALLTRSNAEMGAFFGGLEGETGWLASVSPERFLRVRSHGAGERGVTVSPIKGTRPRGASSESDEVLRTQLLDDEKERAEHLMVVDLERNDLGVVCLPGSVVVDPLYEVISTPYCHQLVSSVHGILRPDVTFFDLLSATFPCGSVTGAPKIAAMRIAGELEASTRGAYCGALLVAMPGELDSSVLIRTMEGVGEGRAVWGAGCGLTYDSDPVAEHLEMLLKASPATGDEPPATALRETMRVTFGQAPLLERHLTRLSEGGTGPSTLARVREEVARRLAEVDSAVPYARLALTVTPDGEVTSGLSHDLSSLAVDGGPRIVPVEVAEAPALPCGAAKPASRRYWDKPHRAARMAGGDQAILHLADGTILDGSTASVWLVSGGRLLTPPAPPAVAGVARGLVFDIACELGIPAEERRLCLHDLEAADEVFLSNGVGLIVPARGRGGEVTRRVAEGVEALFMEAAVRGG